MWKTVKLGDVCDFQNGLWKGKKAPFVLAYVIRSTNFTESGKLSFDNVALFEVEEKQLASRTLQYGDIILEKSGGGDNTCVGRVCVFEKNVGDKPYSLSNFTSIIRAKDSSLLDYRYLHNVLYFMHANGKMERMELRTTGIRNLDLSQYKDIELPSPPLAEQKAIANTLQTWDTAIEKTEALIKAKELRFRWLIKKLMYTSADDWNSCALKEICEIITGKKNVNQGNPDGQYPFFTCAEEHTYSDSYSYDMEAILLAGNGYIGNPILYRGKFEAYQRTYILHNFKNVDAEYLNYFLKMCLQKKVDQEKQQGAMPYIKLGTLQTIKIIMPPLEEQKRIAEILDTARREIDLLKNLVQQYRTQKSGLMQKLLSGKSHIKHKETS